VYSKHDARQSVPAYCQLLRQASKVRHQLQDCMHCCQLRKKKMEPISLAVQPRRDLPPMGFTFSNVGKCFLAFYYSFAISHIGMHQGSTMFSGNYDIPLAVQ